MSAPSRTAQGTASREKILEVSLELFAKQSYAGTSISMICKRAGVAATAVYWHFESKEGLLAAVLERVAGTWAEQIRRSVYEVDGPDRLDRLLAGFRDLVENQLDALSLLLALSLHPEQGGPEVRNALERIHTNTFDVIIEGFERVIGRPVPDLDLVAFTILAHLDSLAIGCRRDPDLDLDRHFQHIKEIVLAATINAINKVDA